MERRFNVDDQFITDFKKPVATTEIFPDSSNNISNLMFWYWKEMGNHTHIRVFMNGGKAGDLCFTNNEFAMIKKNKESEIIFINE